MRVLIVDDQTANRKLLEKYLGSICQCDMAENGQQAVDAVKLSHDQNLPYDLVLLDMMMPIKDGNQTLKEIRQSEEDINIMGLDGVKVIMITANDQKECILRSFENGCEAYIVKPVQKQDLFKQIELLGFSLQQHS